MRPEYGHAEEDEVDTLAGILCRSFATSAEAAQRWFDRTGLSCQRVLRHQGGRPVASLTSLPMGQYFGGRRVPMNGIAAVGCAPEHRGRGAATRLLQSHVRELAGEGVSLSMLYPATVPLYRRAGYEHAGARFEVRLPLRSIDVRDRELTVRPLDGEDLALVHGEEARRRNGWLDRHPFLWSRVYRTQDGDAEGYAAVAGDVVEGYAYLTRARNDTLGHYDVRLTDVVALTARAGRRLLAFLADHGSLGYTATWYGGPTDPLIAHLGEPKAEVRQWGTWMLRITEVTSALEARGWPVAVSATLHLEVEDELVAANRGRYVLELEAGDARVRRGGEGRLALHVRDLASLYSGYQSATALNALGRLRAASERDVAVADAAFAGAFPSCPDVF